MYNKLLNKEQVLKINEKAVDFDQSVLGVLSKASLSPISWLTGSIKRGVKKQQIRTLISQWGLEYVKALEQFDSGNKAPESSSNDSENSITNVDSKLSEDEKNTYIDTLTKEKEYVDTIKSLVNEMLMWTNVDTKNTEFLNVQQKVKDVLNSTNLKSLITNPKVKIENVQEYENVIKTLNIFLQKILVSNNVREFINSLSGLNNVKKELNKINISIDDLLDIYELCLAFLQDTELGNIVESILEGINLFQLPTNIESVLPKDDLVKFEQIKDIKKKTFPFVNLIRLNAIMYEAKYLIEKSKLNKKDTDDDTLKLQKMWDLGITKHNDYFQNVIDVEQVMRKVNGHVDADLKKEFENEQKNIDQLQKLGITETFAVGQKFDVKRLYAFTITLNGQTGTRRKYNILVSPTTNFNEDGTDNGEFFFFKLFGAYLVDPKTNKITWINLFENATSQKKIINNFTDRTPYYIALSNLRPSSKKSDMFVYTRNGELFYNSDKFTNTDEIKDEIVKYADPKLDIAIKNIFKLSNIFNYTLDQRYIIEEQNVIDNKYPGITKVNLNLEKEVDIAKDNHKKLIDYLVK